MRYAIGYKLEGRFVVLRECEGIHVALAIAKALKSKGRKDIEIRKRA